MRGKKLRYILLAEMLAVMAAVWLIYGASVRLPFYSDDIYHFRWAEARNLSQLWAPSAAFASYRPLPACVWYVWRQGISFYSPPAFHALNLLLHTANAWLAMALARRLFSNAAFVGAVGLGFALYPFAYQAVLWVGALTHLLGAFLLLLTLLFYERGRLGSKKWLGLSWCLAMLAPFANEAGLVVAGLVALYEWASPRLGSRRHLGLSLAYLPAALFQPLIWLTGPQDASQGPLHQITQLHRLLPKVGYFAQGATFPFQFVAGRLVALADWEGWWALGAGAVLALLLLLFVYRRARWREGVLAGGWVLLTVLPPAVALSMDYIGTAPRLLYIPAVGISILWARAVLTLPAVLSQERRQTAISTVLLLAILAPSALFICQRANLYRQAARPMLQALDVSRDRAHPSDAPLLFVNMPAWIAYKGFTFPVGREGVPLMPSYVDMADFIWANTGQEIPAKAVAFANVRQPQPYWYAAWQEEQNWESLARAIRTSEIVYLCRWQSWDIRLVKVGGLAPAAPAPHPLAVFEGEIKLWDAEFLSRPDGAYLVLTWSIKDRVATQDSVFVHLLDSSTQLVGQADGPPLAGMFPFWLWQPGDHVRDVRWLPTPPGSSLDVHVVHVGLYDPLTGLRRRALDAEGHRFPDDVVSLFPATLSRNVSSNPLQ